MSIACQKQYSLTVKTPLVVDAYWTMEEAGIGVNKVDKVNGVVLSPQVAAGFDSTGYNGGPGFIGNGLQSGGHRSYDKRRSLAGLVQSE